MNNELSKAGDQALVRSLDRAEVLGATVQQLRKDLALAPEALPEPEVGDAAFEQLRASVLRALDHWTRTGSSAFSRAVNRVDLTERMVNDATDRGGLHELAALMVQRCLLKVMLRKRFSEKG